jgi:hypothetical protein
MQQCIPFDLLSSYKILGTAVNNIQVLRPSWKLSHFRPILNKFEVFRQIFVVPIIKFNKNTKPYYMRTDGRTDGRTWMANPDPEFRSSGEVQNAFQLSFRLTLSPISIPRWWSSTQRLMVTGRPTGGQQCRRSCRPSTALRWHGFCCAAILNPVDRETNLLLHKFWGAQCGDYADRHILGCDAVQCGINLARFWNKFLLPSSR